MDLNLLTIFLCVAQHRNFRVAADHLGVTRSAVSQGVRRLEDACGVALVSRTTRSVHLTEAGELFLNALSQPMADITKALDMVSDQGAPRGHLRLAVTSIAEDFLSGPLMADFARSFPDITIDITVTDDEFDIVAAGYDAGVRLGAVIEQDMIAIAVTDEQRDVVVATPGYFQEHGVPQHPRDLIHHRCIGWRPAPGHAPYRWEFTENGDAFDVAVNPQITTNDLSVMVRTALAGGGVTFATRATFQPYLARNDLVSVLDAYLPPFAGFYLYFPNRRNMAPKLRALVDFVRQARTPRETG